MALQGFLVSPVELGSSPLLASINYINKIENSGIKTTLGEVEI